MVLTLPDSDLAAKLVARSSIILYKWKHLSVSSNGKTCIKRCLMSTNSILAKLEHQIQEVQNGQNPQKLWLATALIRDSRAWQYDRRCSSFITYMQSNWGYEKSQSYNLALAGKAIYGLLTYSDFNSSKLPLPRTLDSSICLGRHSPPKIFSLWRDYCEKGIEIPKNTHVSNVRESSHGRLTKIDEAFDLLLAYQSATH
jgi:hypothetical protein